MRSVTRSQKPPATSATRRTRKATPAAAPPPPMGSPGDTARVPANKGRKYPAEVLRPEEVTALLRACSTRAPTGIRNRALIAVLYRGGLRVAEALALHPKDLDLDRGAVRVLHGKGDQARTVALDPGALALVERWLTQRHQLGVPSRRRLFCTLTGGPLDPSYVRRLLPRLAARAGVDKRVHAHGLRHTHAAELAREGKPINLIRDQLGHHSLATTDRYLRDIAPEERLTALRARTWEP